MLVSTRIYIIALHLKSLIFCLRRRGHKIHFWQPQSSSHLIYCKRFKRCRSSEFHTRLSLSLSLSLCLSVSLFLSLSPRTLSLSLYGSVSQPHWFNRTGKIPPLSSWKSLMPKQWEERLSESHCLNFIQKKWGSINFLSCQGDKAFNITRNKTMMKCKNDIIKNDYIHLRFLVVSAE